MLLLLFTGCLIGKNQDSAYFDAPDVFCDDFSEAGTESYTEVESLGSNGRLEAQLIVDSSNPRDTSIVGNATYFLESLDVGGGENQYQAGHLGDLSNTLGAGNWEMQIEGITGCSNQLSLVIEAGQTLQMCIPLYCSE